jgi:hypothetical protein
MLHSSIWLRLHTTCWSPRFHHLLHREPVPNRLINSLRCRQFRRRHGRGPNMDRPASPLYRYRVVRTNTGCHCQTNHSSFCRTAWFATSPLQLLLFTTKARTSPSRHKIVSLINQAESQKTIATHPRCPTICDQLHDCSICCQVAQK